MLEAGLEPATLGYLIIIIRPTLYQLSYTSFGGRPRYMKLDSNQRTF